MSAAVIDLATRRGRLTHAACLSAAPGGIEVDPHPEWEAELVRIDEHPESFKPEWDALSDDQKEPLFERYREVQEWIFTRPPRTLSGAAAVIRAVVHFHDAGFALGEDELNALKRVAEMIDDVADRRPQA